MKKLFLISAFTMVVSGCASMPGGGGGDVVGNGLVSNETAVAANCSCGNKNAEACTSCGESTCNCGSGHKHKKKK